MAVTIEIHATKPILDLAARFPEFQVLVSTRVREVESREWHWKTGRPANSPLVAHRSLVVFFGKTGYGKSTTLNRFVGSDDFKTSAYDSCTRTCQAADYVLGDENYLSFVDLPGLGEHVSVDQGYLSTYDEFLQHADVVVYLLRADQRDITVDERFLQHLRGRKGQLPAIIFAINCCDKLGPLSRAYPFQPTSEHERLFQEKREWASRVLKIDPGMIVMYSAEGNWGLDALAKLLAGSLIASKTFESR